MKKYWFLIVSIAVMGLSNAAVAHPSTHPLLIDFPASVLFDSEVKHYQQAVLVAGEIIYQNTEGEDEGYLASAQIQVMGESHSYLNDYSANNSALHLSQEMISRLQTHNFELIYQCADISCGDVSGWQLYLSNRLEGDESSQRYVLARQQGRDNTTWFIQFYAIDLDGEPRTFLKIIHARPRPQLALAINTALLTYSNNPLQWTTKGDYSTVLFAINQSQLSPEAEIYIASLAHEYDTESIEGLVLTGHTDNSGSADDNNQLAHERALAVAGAFKTFDNLNAIDIKTVSLGESSPVASNSTAAGREKNRRVSITAVLTSTSDRH